MSYSRPAIPAPERKLREAVEHAAPLPTRPEPFLLDNTALAGRIGLSDLEVSDLRRAGCPRVGRRWHVETVTAWILAHPDFSRPFKAKRAARVAARRVKCGRA